VRRIGVLAPPLRRLGQAVAAAKLAERIGCDSVWVPQQEYARDALVTLSAYGSATTRTGLGTAVLPMYSMHPAAMVQAAATLDEMTTGRFRLGLGVGHRSIVAGSWGIEPGPALAVAREYISIVRTGLREGRVDHVGERFEVHWSYAGPRRPDLPILLAALRPRMLELAGEVADGVILWLATPEYVRDVALPAIQRGLERGGRSLAGFEVAVIVHVCNTEDIETGKDLTARILNPALRFGSYQAILDAQGLHPPEGTRASFIDEVAAIGGADLIRARIDRYLAAGCTLPLIAPCPDHAGAAGVGATLTAIIS
jgi:F420-dependent oxidoreductase-like protein